MTKDINEINARVEKDKVVIEIPLDILVFSQENRPDDPFKISRQKEMAEYVAQNIINFDEDQETGDSRFHNLIDDLFVQAYEDAEDWLELEHEGE
jgi:hypothetical protein